MSSELARYAELIVRVGANVQPGQVVFVHGLVEHAPLIRAVTESAYAAGARYVDAHYGDQHVRKAFITHSALEILFTRGRVTMLGRARWKSDASHLHRWSRLAQERGTKLPRLLHRQVDR